MTGQVQSNYSYSHRYKGEVTLSLFDKYYLHVREKKLKRVREFKMELATLDPEPHHISSGANHWLLAALIALAADGYLIYDAVTAESGGLLDPMTLLAVIASASVLAALFSALYLFSLQRKWVLETRASRFPLIEVPYHGKDKAAAKAFVEELRIAILRNVQDKEYNDDMLSAGELRMLRRLVKKQILSDKAYNKAKDKILAPR
jgi:hypothetical protein